MMILKIHQFLMMQWQQQQQSKENLAQCFVVITLNPIHLQHVQACFSKKNSREFYCDLSKPSSSSACSSFCKNISHFRFVLWERKGNTDTDRQFSVPGQNTMHKDNKMVRSHIELLCSLKLGLNNRHQGSAADTGAPSLHPLWITVLSSPSAITYCHLHRHHQGRGRRKNSLEGIPLKKERSNQSTGAHHILIVTWFFSSFAADLQTTKHNKAFFRAQKLK